MRKQQGKHDELNKTIALNQAKVKQNPKDIEALEMLCGAHLKLQNYQAAAQLLSDVLKIDAKQIWAYQKLSNIYSHFGKHDEAKNLIRQALLIDSNDANSHLIFGTLLSEENNLVAGEWHFRRALSSTNLDPEIKSKLALCLMQQGKTDESYTLFEQASTLAPHDFKILAQWSKLCEVTGNLEQATSLLNTASSIASPDAVDLLRSSYYARTGKYQKSIDVINKAKNPSGDALLERGRAYDRIGEYDKAWSDFTIGKQRIVKEAPNLNYQKQAVENFFSELSSFITPEIVSQLPIANVRGDCPQPIFIFGSPRSGTTLTERVLSAHSQISAGGELTFLPELRELANKVLPTSTFPNNLAFSCTADFRHVATLFRDQYLARAESAGLFNSSADFFTDKMPFNEIYLPILKMAFPEAPIIQLTRNPLDVCVSMMSHRINHGFHCAYKPDDIFHHLNAVWNLRQHYERAMETDILFLKYEDFVLEQESVTERMIKHVGLPFEKACLNFQKNRTYTPTPSYIQVQSKVNDSAIERHKNYSQHLQAYEDQFSNLLLNQGY